MSLKRNTANGEVSGTSMYSGNSGGASGDEFSNVATAGGGSVLFDNTHYHSAPNGYLVSGESGFPYIQIEYTLADPNYRLQFQSYFYFTGYPSSTVPIIEVGGPIRIRIHPNGSLSSYGNYSANTISSPSSTVPLNTLVRIDVYIGVDDSFPTDGPLVVKLSLGESTTPLWMYDGVEDNGSDPISFARVGILDFGLTIPSYWFDDITLSNDGTTILAPYIAGPPPFTIPLGFVG